MNTNPIPSPKSPHWFTGRTRLVTITSVVGVALAASVAFGANLGILGSAGDTNVGNVTANELSAPAGESVDVSVPATGSGGAPLEAAGSTTVVPPSGSGHVQEFEVDVAGTVSVVRNGDSLTLKAAVPNAGWTWNLTQTKSSSLHVGFTNGKRSFEFDASLGADGSILARVDEPLVKRVPSGNSTTASRSGDDHDDDKGEHDDDKGEHGDDKGDESHYEGHDDDD